MSLRIHSSPWARFAGEEGTPIDGDSISLLRSAVHPRLVGDVPARATWCASPPQPAVRPHEGHLGSWDVALPRSGEQSQAIWRSGGTVALIEMSAQSARATDSERDDDPREVWLRWQLQRYAELSDLSQSAKAAEAKLRWGARRTWSSVAHQWRQDGEDQAEMALVVELAQDRRLVGALRAIERSPRRMLLRRHEKVKISRIQEMDSATLRAYSQAPGSNAVQKAGSKQELLAVVRQDTVDLVENRILLWAAKRMRSMAAAYCKRNSRFTESDRFQDVRRLRQLCLLILRSAHLEEVGALPHHLDAPTYCLQFERRYRRLWWSYRRIRRQERIEDDAWQWQTRLWGTSARLIAASMLLGLEGWNEARTSMPYIRHEGICGIWVDGPSTPGPFDTPYGVCHVLDLRTGLRFLGGADRRLPDEALESGADWILVWPERRRLLLFWSAVANGATETDSDGLGSRALVGRLQKLSEGTAWDWGAILFIAEPLVEPEALEPLDADPRLVTLRVPRDVHSRWGDVQAGLDLALEELHHV